MSRRLPPLNALRVFEAAARQGSFARAAEELHVTPAAVSQQIKLLEEHLGIALFNRGRILELSDAARAMLPALSDAFDQMERAIAQIRDSHEQGALVVSTAPAFAARWLIPRLEDLHARHPGIDLRLMATQRLVDFSVEEVDAAIRFGDGHYPGLVVERLSTESIVAVAAPTLAATLKHPQDLIRHTLLEDEWHTSHGTIPEWQMWLAAMGVTTDKPLRLQRFGDTTLALQAAVAGLGITLAWQSLVQHDIDNGRLMHVLGHSIPSTLGYHFVTTTNRAELIKVKQFREWLFEQV